MNAARRRPTARCSLIPIALVLLAMLAVATPGTAHAEDLAAGATYQPLETTDTGIVSLIGPQIGMHGPPTAFKVQAQVWHNLIDRLAFHLGAAMTFGGETTFEASHPDAADAHYDITVGGELSAGVRYLLDFGDLPFDTWVRGALAVDLTGGEEFIGYMFGPSAAIGLTYPLVDGLDLVADAEVGLGYGQYKAQGSVFAATLDLLVGAQIAF